MKDLLDQLQALSKDQIEIITKVKHLLTDQSLTLEDRWALYSTACNLGLLGQYGGILDLPTLNTACGGEVCWYNDFSKEKHETVYLLDLVSNLEWEISYNTTNSLKLDEKMKFFSTKENLDRLKEDILACGYSSFEYDW